MRDYLKFYINGEWVDPVTPRALDVQNPATEESYARISIGSKADVDKAVAAAKAAFKTFSQTTREERIALMGRIIEEYKKRAMDLAVSMAKSGERQAASPNHSGITSGSPMPSSATSRILLALRARARGLKSWMVIREPSRL